MERFQVVVVGGGQAGLAAAHELERRGVTFVVLEAADRVGDQWRKRWDSLRLFTPARFDALPGSEFPAPPASFPAKDEVADYLEAYSRKGRLPVRTGVRALKLERGEASYRLETSAGTVEADHVVIATGYSKPRIPQFAVQLNPDIKQLHAADYRNPSQLRGDVLVVGAGTSGVEVAIEAAGAGHRTILAGRATGSIPPFVYGFDGAIFWFYANRLTSLKTPIGRRMRPLVRSHGAPLVRIKMSDATAAGVELAPRVASVENGLPTLVGGRRIEPGTIVWCTGFHRDYSWIKFPVAGPDGYPRQRDGVAEGETGLYFVGLPFQTRLASALICGVAEDARLVADAIETRLRQARESRSPVGPAADPVHAGR